VVEGVIFLYKVNSKTDDEIMAEKNKVVVGEENILYVDLTKKPNDYEKTSKVEKSVNKEVQVNENVFNQINQYYFDMEFDLDSEIATVDGNEVNIVDLLEITEEKSELLSSKEALYNYLNDNIIGDIEYQDGKIKIENPYSTNTIMMKTSNLTEIEDCGEAQSIVKVADNIYCVHYENAIDTKEGYNLLKENDLVENICKDGKVKILDDVIVNDEGTVNVLGVSEDFLAWGVNSTRLICYRNKLNYENNNNEIKVAVLDTGVRITHNAFSEETTSDRIDTTYSYNYVDNNKDITDENHHGTNVAGIIAESTSKNVKIVPVKVIGSNGEGKLSDIVEALSTIESKVDVINLSFEVTEGMSSDKKDLVEEVFKQIYDNGKLVVVASGNDGIGTVSYPASSKYTFAVSALDKDENIADYSNYGSEIDFAAPGSELRVPHNSKDDAYAVGSGTSFAAPFVSAATAMIKAENTNYTVTQVKDVLKENCEDLGEEGKDNYYGYGGLDFSNNMFSKPVIASVNVPKEWGKKNDVSFYVVRQ
jgi:subtilisin family serine protease